MKTMELLTCVCTQKEKTGDGKTGLPILGLYIEGDDLFFAACCPKCGRGNRYKGTKTPEEALEEWNTMQRKLEAKIPESTKRKIRSEFGPDKDD